MDAAGPSRLRATRRRVANSLSRVVAPLLRVFQPSRSFWLCGDLLCAVELCSRTVMFLRTLQHVIVWCRLPFEIIRRHVIFPHRMIDKLVPHQNPPQIRMPVEVNSVEIVNLALLELGTTPHWRD